MGITRSPLCFQKIPLVQCENREEAERRQRMTQETEKEGVSSSTSEKVEPVV